MPQIGWFEILIIVGLAIIVIGPKDFPLVLRKFGSWIGTIKRYVSNFSEQVSNIENESIDIDSQSKKTEVEAVKKETDEQK